MPGFKTKAPVADTGVVSGALALNGAFAPLTALYRAMRFWWLIAALAVAGGLAGWLLHLTRPPVYEAAAQFSASIDYVNTGPLTQFEEDTALNAIGDLLTQAATVQAVAQKAQAEGIAIQPGALASSLTFERRVNVWLVRVRATNPHTADRLAAIYAGEGRALLLQSYQHSLAADRLDRYMRALEDCLSQSAASETANVACSRPHFADIQADLQKAGAAYDQERLAGGDLSSGLLIGPSGVAYPAGKPVLFTLNQMVLAGGLIGLLVGIWLVQWNILDRWTHRKES